MLNPNSLKAKPADNYDDLKKQFFALKNLCESKIKQCSIYSNKLAEYDRESILARSEALESEKEMNAQLTEELAKANEREKRLEKILQRYESEQLQPVKQRVKELETHANCIADALGFNAENNNRFATSVICTNIRNLHSFSDCLSLIENAFLMVESETDEFGETSEDVAFSKWGLTPHEYCIEFGKWLNKFALEQRQEAVEEYKKSDEFCKLLDSHFNSGKVYGHNEYYEQLRKEQEK